MTEFVTIGRHDDAMKGDKQLERSQTANVALPAIWDILTDSSLLPQWAPVVDRVEAHDASERVGSVRRCAVDMAGRAGNMVERCVDVIPQKSLAYVVDEDSFGMNRMFAHYGFVITLDAVAAERTRVTIATYYRPKNVVYRLMNALIMRRQFRGVVDDLIAGLISFCRTAMTSLPRPALALPPPRAASRSLER